MAKGIRGGKRRLSETNLTELSQAHEFEEQTYFEATKKINGISNHEDWDYSLTDTEAWAVNKYTTKMFKEFNSKLREGKSLSDEESYIKQGLDSAISKFELKEPLMVARYTGINYDGIKVGATIDLPAYTSSSVSYKQAMQFRNTAEYKGGDMMRIKVNPGKGKGAYIAEHSDRGYEQEFLNARNAKFTVTKITRKRYADGTEYNEIEVEY